MNADLILSVGGFIFLISSIPQILNHIKTHDTQHLSWGMLTLIIISIGCFILGKSLAHCHIASIIDSVSLVGYLVLVVQKMVYK